MTETTTKTVVTRDYIKSVRMAAPRALSMTRKETENLVGRGHVRQADIVLLEEAGYDMSALKKALTRKGANVEAVINKALDKQGLESTRMGVRRPAFKWLLATAA